METLTGKQREMLEQIKAHMLTNVVPPTVRELCGYRGTAINATRQMLQVLQRKGYLRADTHKIVPIGARVTFLEI